MSTVVSESEQLPAPVAPEPVNEGPKILLDQLDNRVYLHQFSRTLLELLIEHTLGELEKSTQFGAKSTFDSINSRVVAWRGMKPDSPSCFYFPSCTCSFYIGFSKPHEQPPISVQITTFSVGELWRASYGTAPAQHIKMRKDGSFNIAKAVNAIVTAEQDALAETARRRTARARSTDTTTFREREKQAIQTALGIDFNVFKSPSSYDFSVRELNGIFVSEDTGKFRVNIGTLEGLTGAQFHTLMTFIKENELRKPGIATNYRSSQRHPGFSNDYEPIPSAPLSTVVDDDKGTISSGIALPPKSARTGGGTAALESLKPGDSVTASGSCNCCKSWSTNLVETATGWLCPVCRTPPRSPRSHHAADCACTPCTNARHEAWKATKPCDVRQFRNMDFAIDSYTRENYLLGAMGIFGSLPYRVYSKAGQFAFMLQGDNLVEVTEFGTQEAFAAFCTAKQIQLSTGGIA